MPVTVRENGEIDTIGRQAAQQHRVGILDRLDRPLRESVGIGSERGAELACDQGIAEPDPQRVTLSSGEGRSVPVERVHVVDDPPCPVEEGGPRLCRHHPARRSGEDRKSKALFEIEGCACSAWTA